MKRLLFSSALAAALALPAFAGTDTAPAPAPAADGKDMKDTKQQVAQTEQSDAGFYMAVLGGANFDTFYGNNHQTLSTPTGSTPFSTNNNISSALGGVGGIKLGYDFNSFAVGNMWGLRLQPAAELEGLYVGEDKSRVNGFFTSPDSENFSSNSADVFLNGIIRFKNDSIVTPYLGIGVGMQYITTHGVINTPAGSVTGLDTSDWDFAGQALFGIDVRITEHLSLFTEYKFIDAIGTDAKNANVGPGDTYRFKPDQIQQNLITAGVKYTF